MRKLLKECSKISVVARERSQNTKDEAIAKAEAKAAVQKHTPFRRALRRRGIPPSKQLCQAVAMRELITRPKQASSYFI